MHGRTNVPHSNPVHSARTMAVNIYFYKWHITWRAYSTTIRRFADATPGPFYTPHFAHGSQSKIDARLELDSWKQRAHQNHFNNSHINSCIWFSFRFSPVRRPSSVCCCCCCSSLLLPLVNYIFRQLQKTQQTNKQHKQINRTFRKAKCLTSFGHHIPMSIATIPPHNDERSDRKTAHHQI